jgi:hypothetical protein
MKKIYLLALVLFSSLIYSQTKGITYQAVILNPEGEHIPGYNNDRSPLTNTKICLRFSIYKETVLEYQETINTTTDEFGMVNTIIGSGIYISGTSSTLAAVDWDGNSRNLVVEVDTNGTCSLFSEISDQPFTYVPYAFYAENCGTPGPAGPQGTVGNSGLSAYQVAVSNGYTGTEAQWLASLVGATGPQGNAGTNGNNGVDGKNTLINTTTEPAGATCTNGGVKMEYGLDTNSNNILDASEINNSLTKYVCNGSNASSAGIFTHYIGELYGGGIIVSLWFSEGVEHGLIMSLTDLCICVQSNVQLFGIASSMNNGLINTNEIISADPSSQNAAWTCSNYNGGGFNDWYLPAIDELRQIFYLKSTINNILPDSEKLRPINQNETGLSVEYWSSTNQLLKDFYNNNLSDSASNNTIGLVRAVRKF